MPDTEDFRFQSHHLLLDLDAATAHLMMLVVGSELSGTRWDQAIARHKMAYEVWAASLAGMAIDPMPAFDGRPTKSSTPPSD